MRRTFITTSVVLACILFVAACSQYGKKVKINEMSEVYIKDGGTEKDAKRLGQFLLDMNYFDNQSRKSIQLTKSKDTFVVRFVVDSMKFKGNVEIELGFQYLSMQLKDSVFSGRPTKILLTDNAFKTFKEIEGMTAEDIINITPADTDSANTETAPQ